MSLEEEGDEEVFDVASAADDLLVSTLAVGTDGGEFETVERALSGQGLAAISGPYSGHSGGIAFANDGGEPGVASEVVVVVEILVTQGQAVDPLGEQFLNSVFNEVGVAMIGETVCKLSDDAGELLGFAKQQCAVIGSDLAAVKIGENFSGSDHGKIEVG